MTQLNSHPSVQGRLRRIFSDHLGVVVEWHAKVLREAKTALLDRDEAAGWRPASARGGGGSDPGGGAGRLDSARALILESRSQAENSLPVLRQSSTSVAAFSEAISSVLTVRPPRPYACAVQCILVHQQCLCRCGWAMPSSAWRYPRPSYEAVYTGLPHLEHRQRQCLCNGTSWCTSVLALEFGMGT